MPAYFVEHPKVGVKAEVNAPTPRSAKTAYLDYLRRNKIIPWRGSTTLRGSIITDKIESGSVAVDVNLQYGSDSAPSSSESSITLGPTESTSGRLPVQGPKIEVSKSAQPLRNLYLRPTKIGLRSKRGL